MRKRLCNPTKPNATKDINDEREDSKVRTETKQEYACVRRERERGRVYLNKKVGRVKSGIRVELSSGDVCE